MSHSGIETGRRRLLKGAAATACASLCSSFTEPARAVDRAGESIVSSSEALQGEWVDRQISTGNLSIEYFELGNPKGVPLVLLHGFPDTPLSWKAISERLDHRRFRLVMPFLRGFGKTVVKVEATPTGQQAALSTDVIALLDTLQIDKCHLVGHDWGAKSAYGVAVLAPNRLLSLTALATAYDFWKGGLYPPKQVHGNWYQFYFQTKAAEMMLKEHAVEFCEELWRTWSPTWHFTQHEFLTASAAWTNPQFVDIVLSYYRLRWGGRASLSPLYSQSQAKLDAKPKAQINVPTTFVQGAADACDLFQGADGQERYFTAGYERTILAGVGHFPHREQPEQVAQAIMKRINGV